jgi:hypothetical protein
MINYLVVKPISDAVHYGINFNRVFPDHRSGRYAIGFDCGHAGDIVPSTGVSYPGDTYKDINFTINEIDNMLNEIEQQVNEFNNMANKHTSVELSPQDAYALKKFANTEGKSLEEFLGDMAERLRKETFG